MLWEDINNDPEIVNPINIRLEKQKHEYENIIANMRLEHTYLHNEITRLNNSYYEKEDTQSNNKIVDETEKKLCEELVNFLDENKNDMKNQTYIKLMEKLSEIYKR